MGTHLYVSCILTRFFFWTTSEKCSLKYSNRKCPPSYFFFLEAIDYTVKLDVSPSCWSYKEVLTLSITLNLSKDFLGKFDIQIIWLNYFLSQEAIKKFSTIKLKKVRSILLLIGHYSQIIWTLLFSLLECNYVCIQ